MSHFNNYISQYDYSWFIDFMVQHGTLVQFRKNEAFCAVGIPCKTMGFIRKGAFMYCANDRQGERHVVGYAFEDSFVGNYGAFRLKQTSAIDITALCESEVYLVTYEALNRFITADAGNREHYLRIIELMFSEVYERYVSTYIKTPEERYTEILHRCPEIFNYITAKDFASYLQIAPETLSRIRRKLKER